MADSPNEIMLLTACEGGKLAVVRRLLEAEGLDIDGALGVAGDTPLGAAAKNGNLEIVDYLVEKGAQLGIGNLFAGDTPLHHAARKGQEQVARYLLEAGSAVDLRANDGATPLLVAAQFGYDGVARLLLEAGAEINAAAADGVTPLYAALTASRSAGVPFISVVRCLLDAGAALDSPILNGWSPLLMAVLSGQLVLVKSLVERGPFPPGKGCPCEGGDGPGYAPP